MHDEDAAARQKARKWQKGKEKEVPAVPKYRDRARERRDGDNPDYEETEAQLAGFHSVPPPSAETMYVPFSSLFFLSLLHVPLLTLSSSHPPCLSFRFYAQNNIDPRGNSKAELQKISIENSKYLGGGILLRTKEADKKKKKRKKKKKEGEQS